MVTTSKNSKWRPSAQALDFIYFLKEISKTTENNYKPESSKKN